MTFGYLLIAAILFSCILADRFSGKFGMPALILFMAVGMIFGCDGLFKIQFDNYGVAEKVCAAALVFIHNDLIAIGWLSADELQNAKLQNALEQLCIIFHRILLLSAILYYIFPM